MNIAIVIPTFNAGHLWPSVIDSVKNQTCKIKNIVIVDSGSTDNTRALAEENGFEVHAINQADFDHGGTRQFALSLLKNIDIAVFLTQDAILADSNAIQELVDAFNDTSISAAYGRQLPRLNASAIEIHGRLFNYPDTSMIKKLSDLDSLGFSLIFISNAFAAYRISALNEIGGFPSNIILGEDTYACANLLKKRGHIAYQANATVYHSHDYTIWQEATRYFDTGVFHARESWLIKKFGNTSNRGLKFIQSELLYLLQNNILRIPESIIRTILKYGFYKLGKVEEKIPLPFKKHLSMNKMFWVNNHK